MSFRFNAVPGAQARPAFASLPAKLVAVVLGSALLAIAAQVTVPFWPVPITLQTLAVLLIGAVAGPMLGAATVVAYLVEGVSGLPVFAHHGGFTELSGPLGGYLVGFIAAAYAAGLAAQRGWMRTVPGALASFLVADALVFVFGLAWLSLLFGPSKAIAVGLMPFLIGEAIKIALATAATRFWMESRPVK